VESEESPRDALVRELAEELGIEAAIADLIEEYDYTYTDAARSTRLLFYRIDHFTGEPQNLDFEQIRWVERRDLPRYDFLAGDIAFVARLATT
jgi:mutator protein MutT